MIAFIPSVFGELLVTVFLKGMYSFHHQVNNTLSMGSVVGSVVQAIGGTNFWDSLRIGNESEVKNYPNGVRSMLALILGMV